MWLRVTQQLPPVDFGLELPFLCRCGAQSKLLKGQASRFVVLKDNQGVNH